MIERESVFSDAAAFEIAGIWGLRPPNLAISFLDSLSWRTMILWCIGGDDDAAEEAQDDGIERSVPGAVGPDHQHEARAGCACRQDRLGLDRRRDRAALQRERPARDRDPLHDRAVVAQAHLRAVR